MLLTRQIFSFQNITCSLPQSRNLAFLHINVKRMLFVPKVDPGDFTSSNAKSAHLQGALR